MSNEAGSAKVCSMCGQDVSGKPRSKDAEGRYVCADCLKGKAPEGGAKPQAKAPAKAKASEDNAFLLDLGGKPLEVALCSNCQQPLRPKAKICTLCGYDPEHQTTLKTKISKDKPPKERGPKVKQPMGPGTKFFLGAVGPVAIAAGVYVGTGDSMAAMAANLLSVIIGLVVWIWGIVAGFKTGLLHGVLMIVTLGLWGLYYIFVVQEDARLKGAYGGSWASGILLAVVAAVVQPPEGTTEPGPAPAWQTAPAPTTPTRDGPST